MNLIPKPYKYTLHEGYCNLDNLIYYYIDDEISDSKEMIYSILRIGLKRELELKKGSIDIFYNKYIQKEGYRLNVSNNAVIIEASDSVGALYAVQSLRILGEFDLQEPTLQCCAIEDHPAFGWRGLLYDESRHFFGVEATKKLLDMMCLHKLNVLHWHLSDDQGWRIEIKKYPLLTEVGSKRPQSQINGWQSTDVDGIPHSGYYTQKQIREIIDYARIRGIMIIPEIDMPGHFSAAEAAYSYLACRDIKCEVPWYFGSAIPRSIGYKDADRPACVSNPRTIEFIHDILDELCELFPAPYFHIGGDEAIMTEWTTCPRCQAEMKKQGYSDVKQLQCNFINGIQKYIAQKGKDLIGWNEVLKGNLLDKSVLVQYWTYVKDFKVNQHLKKGGNVILSKHQCFYFDMPYAQYQLRNTYKFTPKKCGIPSKYLSQIKGVEGAMWTEWIPDVYKFEFQLYPRLEALSEVAWNQNGKNYSEFLIRLEKFKPILKVLKINYAENQICNDMKLFKRNRIRKQWYGGDQTIELNENTLIKINGDNN